MRRGRAIRAAVVAMVALAVAVPGTGTPASADVPADEVHYTFTGPASVSLDWRGSARDVRYGVSTDYGETAQGAAPAWTPISSPGPFWQAQISGLQPGTAYHYSIGGGPDYTFQAPPAAGAGFRFDAIGDVGDTTQFSKLGNTLSAMASDQPSFVLMVGDLTYANAANVTQAVVDQHFNDVMAWSTHAAYLPAWGNHEWESPDVDDLRNYKGRLLMPNAQASPGSPSISCCGNDWGFFDAGGVRFISYPEPYTSATWSDWRAAASTLMSQAQSDPSINYIVTYGHRPAYSTGFHPGDTVLAGMLDGLGTSYNKYVLNINGHSHDYERFQPIDGVTHVTVGTPSSEEIPWSGTDSRTAFRAFHLAHLRVDVDSTGMRIQAVCDDATSRDDTTCLPGSILDEYAIGTPPPAPAATAFYVDRTNRACSDTGPGDVSTPYCTIAKGTSRVLPGQTVWVGNGSYPEQVRLGVSGTSTQPVTVAAVPGANPVVGAGQVNGIYLANRSYVTLSGLSVSGTSGDGVYVTGGQNITLSGLHVSNSGQPTSTGFAKGIRFVGTTNSTISGSLVDHNTDSGIYLAQGSTGNTVSANTTRDNARVYTRAAAGIDLRSGGNSVLRNISHHNEDSGIQLYTGSDGSLVAGNISYANGDHGIDDLQSPSQRIIGNSVYRNVTSGINLEGGSSSGTVINNISVDNGLNSPRTVGNVRVDVNSQPGTTVDSNLVYLHAPGANYVWGTANYATQPSFAVASGQEPRGIEADPRWVSPDTGNLRLTAGSPAIDSADSGVAGQQSTDLAGTARYDDPAVADTGVGARTYDDRGAYEAPAGTTDASPAAALAVTPQSGSSPVTVTASAAGSTDGDSTPIASYAFDFGDGSGSGPQPSAIATHQFTAAGTYNVTVAVTDTAGLTSTAARQVAVGAAGNLIGNSTFETSLAGWSALDGCTLTRVAGGHNEGWTANLANTSTTLQSCTLNDSPNWVAKSVAGRYSAAAWVRSDTVGLQVRLRIREYAGSTLVGTGTSTVTTSGGWQQVQLAYPVANPGSTLDLNVYGISQAVDSAVQVDDVTLASG